MRDTLTWDLSPLYPSDTDPQFAVDRMRVAAAVAKFAHDWEPRTDYLQDPLVLKQALDQYELLMRTTGVGGNETYYFFLRSSQDENNNAIKAQLRQAQERAIKLYNQLQFFPLRLAKVDQTAQQRFLAEPTLRSYRHFLEQLFATARYDLSESEERILNLKSQPAHQQWVQMVSSLLIKEVRHRKHWPQLASELESPKKTKRDRAAADLNSILATHVAVAEAELNAIMADKQSTDELRGLERPDKMRHLQDDMDSAVVDTMLAAVASRFDLPQAYYQLKAKVLGVPRLAYHERTLPVGQTTKAYTFAQARRLVQEVLQELDPEFAAIFRQFVDQRQIDVLPYPGKSGGAFCAIELPTQPTYILLNFSRQLRDVTVLAHEVGHGINNELMKPACNALTFGSPLSTAEVASTFMEDFVVERLLREADEETRLSLLFNKLDNDIGTIFRQVAAYQFEQELHTTYRREGYLSQEKIGTIFQQHMSSYMGPAVEQSPGSQNWWVYWSHFRTFFYVYTYASGLLISKSLQAQVHADPSAIAKVKQFLAAGQSAAPQQIFEAAGVDISAPQFWAEGIAQVEQLLRETQTLAKRLGKI